MNKNDSAATIGDFFNDEPGLLDSQWHYVSVSYGGKQMGLLVETDNWRMRHRRKPKTSAAPSATTPESPPSNES